LLELLLLPFAEFTGLRGRRVSLTLRTQTARAFLGLSRLYDFRQQVVRGHEQDVFRLDVRVDDSAAFVQELQSRQQLAGNLLDEREGRSAIVVGRDDFEHVEAEHLKDHANVRAVRADDAKVVEELDNVLGALSGFVAFAHAFEQLDFVLGRLGVLLGGFDDFEGNMAIALQVTTQPDGGEVAPAELTDHAIAHSENIADDDTVIAAEAVVGIILAIRVGIVVVIVIIIIIIIVIVIMVIMVIIVVMVARTTTALTAAAALVVVVMMMMMMMMVVVVVVVLTIATVTVVAVVAVRARSARGSARVRVSE
jgi:hypothetical protein